MGQEFLGVYATNEVAPSLGDFPRPAGKRKRLWFAWETPDGRYKVQALNAVFQPMAEARVIPSYEFEQRFAVEPGCYATPEGHARPLESEEDGPLSPLPDLFSHDADTAPKPRAFFDDDEPKDDGRLKADDPDLLRDWARMESRFKKRPMDPSKIPFDRLVGEVAQEEPGEGEHTQEVEPMPAFDAEEKPQPEEARLLRSKFVQALLLLRRGEREEAVVLLEDLLAKAYPPFDGAAQLFSEFGLGLRRLGFVRLALAAHQRAWEYAPEDERILFNIARSYHDLDLLDEARDFLEKAILAAPDFTSAKQFLAFLDAGKPNDA
ncbi:MAG: hypothetical protein DELT_01361 [Desulfovibrio sp.]